MSAGMFTYAESPLEVDESVVDSHRLAWDQLSDSGSWWTANEVRAIASRARAVFAVRDQPPWSRQLESAVPGLSEAAVAAVDHLVSSPGSTDAPWAKARIAELGDGHYVELIAVVATVVMIDMFAACAGVAQEPLPDRLGSGEPSNERPTGLGDIGAHVPMIDPFPYANVARALSLVPQANTLFRSVSGPMYSAPGMSDLVWKTPLTRPQVELVASRVAAMNECFY